MNTPTFDSIKGEPLAYLKLLTKNIQNQGSQAIIIFHTPVENFDVDLSKKLGDCRILQCKKC